MKKNLIQILTIITIVITTASCEKDHHDKKLKAVFSYVTDGFFVNFTNFSTNAKEYTWDFGDGTAEASTKRAPFHIYNAKGNYIVTLTVKNGTETNIFKDTVVITGPNIKIDGDFSDWENVEYSIVNDGTSGGTLKALKTFATTSNLNFLLEGTNDMALARISIFMNTDNNSATGYASWQYPLGSGADYKIEGSLTDGWGGMQKHSGDPGAGWGGFSGEIASLAQVISYSTIKTVNGKKTIEFAIRKGRLGTLGNSMTFYILENSISYQQIGALPANQFPEAKYGTYKF